MKKITLTLTLCLNFGLAAIAGDWGLNGSGTEADPYQISSASDFTKMAEKISATNTGLGEYFKVMNDIDFKGTESDPVQLPAIGKAGITNITTVAWGFEGTLDGDNHEIKGIYHTNNANSIEGKFNALFSSLGENGTIKNLVFGSENYVSSYNYVAPFASVSKGVIENCTNNADINATNAFASGICGQMIRGKGTVTGCINNGNISAMTYAVGIIAGTQSGASINEYAYLIEDCVNNGTMSTLNDVGVAGIAGNYSGSVVNCTNKGDIKGNTSGKTTAQYAAGIVAVVSYPVEITGCENYGTVDGIKNVAGILAVVMKGNEAEFTLTHCKNYGPVSCTGDYVAGIIANTKRGTDEKPLVTVSNCHNGGAVTSESGSEFIGNVRGTAAIALGEGNTIEGGLQNYVLDGNSTITGINDSFINDAAESLKDGRYLIDGELRIVKDGKIFNLQGFEIKCETR